MDTEKKTANGMDTYLNYQYDPNGNQISKLGESVSGSGGAAELGIHLLGDTSDADNGNVCELDGYDVFNRLVSVNMLGAQAQYKYQPDGMRMAKTVDGVTTTQVWNGANIVLELNSAGTVTDRYARGIGLIKSDLNGYYLYNAHGDVVQLTNGSGGAVTRNYLYDASDSCLSVLCGLSEVCI